MNIVIVGNGLAGTIASKTVRELDQDVRIDVFARENAPYYPRPNLIEFLAGNLAYERVFAFSESWQTRQRISVHLGRPAKAIFPASHEIELADGSRVSYDKLLLASGASPSIPPFKGTDKKRLYTLRTLNDALEIQDSLKSNPSVIVIGGGLLGLEIARALKSRGAEVEVVEFFERLLPRQLDPAAALLLRAQVEKMGIKIRLGVATEEILGDREVRGVRFKSGEEVEAQMAVVAAGVRPNLEIARDAGLAVDRGIIVNNFLRTSDADIFAAGDCTQHNGRIYGIIPASFDQARAAAYNMIGMEKKYEGTTISNTLKVVGLYVTSVGLVNPEGPGFEEIRKERPEAGIYKKIVVQNGVLQGAIWMGTKKFVGEITNAVLQKKNISRWIDSILEDDFDFSLLS